MVQPAWVELAAARAPADVGAGFVPKLNAVEDVVATLEVDLTSPTARPPVTYSNTRSVGSTPIRPRRVASHGSFSSRVPVVVVVVVAVGFKRALKGGTKTVTAVVGPSVAVPSCPVASMSPSMPNTQLLLNCQL